MTKLRVQTLIPCRMASTRLPNKPLADIHGKPMIVRVWEQASKAGHGSVVVACDCDEIQRAVEAHGGHAVVTDPNLPSGSDRIWAGVQTLLAQGGDKPDIIINVQGDEPLFPPEMIEMAVAAFEQGWPDVVTFAHTITDEADLNDPNVVKVVTNARGQALYFSRARIPHGAARAKRHVGFYAYRYSALERFVAAQPAQLEMDEKLEQLRGLDMGLAYYVGMVDAAPIGVDTPEDLEKVRRLF